MTWHGVKEYCIQSFQLLRICCLWCLLLAEEMPDKRPGMSGVGREEALNVCCLLASHEAQVINKVLMPSILNECQLFRRNHMSRKHQWHRWSLPCLCNGIFAARLPGSWRKLGIWATLVSQANPGYELCGAYHPPQSRVKQCGPSGRENRLILPGTIWKPPSRPQGMRGMGTFGQCPGCSPHVPRLMPSEGRKGNLFFFKYTLTFQFRLKTEMSAWFCYWLFSMWYLEIKRGS